MKQKPKSDEIVNLSLKELLAYGIIMDFLDRRLTPKSGDYGWDRISLEKKVEILADVLEQLIDVWRNNEANL